MRLQTRHFDMLEVEEEKIIEFAEGLPGFPGDKRFILLRPEPQMDENLFWWLQSVDDGDTAFVLMDVYLVKPDYDPQIPMEMISDLGAYTPEDFLVYNIVVVPENVANASVNLRAPVIVNTKTQKGKQVVAMNESYSIRYYIMEDIKHRSG